MSQAFQNLGDRITAATQSPFVAPAPTGSLPVSEAARDRWLAAQAPSTPTGVASVPASPLPDEQAIAIAGRLHDAMYGDLIGTKEQQVFEVLDGLSAEAARQVAYQYEVKYNLQRGDVSPQSFRLEGSLLYSRLKGELTPHGELDENAGDWARAQALLRGDAATADAIGLRTAANKGWPFRDGQEMLDVLRQASPAERQAIVEAFAKDYAEQPHLVYAGIGARVVPATQAPEYSADPATLLMNVLKTRMSGSEFTEAVGLIAAAKYKDSPSVVANSQGQAAVGRLYSLLDRPFPDGAGALEALKNLSPEERRYLQGQAPAQGPSKLEELMQNKLSAADFRQATAYLNGDPATAQATALYEALSRKVQGPRMGAVPNPDLAAAEQILRSVETDEERRALLAALERQYNVSVGALIPKNVSSTNRDVLVALAQTQPEVLSAQASTLAGLPPEAARANLEFRADTLRRSTERLLGVDEAAVRQAFAGLAPEQARSLAGMSLDPAKPGWTLGDELTQWHRGGGGGRFTLELQQMLDGDAAATGNLAAQIDEAQARYDLETSGLGAAVNDAIQSAFGSDARALLDADAARLQQTESLLAAAPAGATTRETADTALAYMSVGQSDYITAKDRTTEAAKTVVTTVAVVGTTMATGGTAAAIWAPVLAGATANVAANQLRGNANSWSDNVVAGIEGGANGIVLFPASAVAARGGQYVVREAVLEGGQVVFRAVPASLARQAAATAVTEGGQQVLIQGGQAMVRVGERYFAVETFQQTLGQAVRQNAAEAILGSIAGDVPAGAIRGDLRLEQIVQNAALAGVTGSAFTVAVHGGQGAVAALRRTGEAVTEAPRIAAAAPVESQVDLPSQEITAASRLDAAPPVRPGPESRIGVDPVVERKLVDPLTRRPEFLALGFHPGRPEELKQVLESTRHLITADTLSADVFNGTLYTVKTDIVGPNGRRGALTAFWELREGEDVPALVSAVVVRVDGRPVAEALTQPPRIAPPVPPLESGVTPTMQDAFVTAMRETDVVEIGLRPLRPEGAGLWHGVGGGTVRDASGTVRNPGPPAPLEPELVDGRRVFPRGPIKGTGAIFPTKPGGAVTLTPEHVQTIDAARAEKGLPPLHVAYPNLPLPRQVTLSDGTTAWAQQLGFGGVRPVLVNSVKDASGRIVDGEMLLAAPDVDIAYARARDGHLLTDDEINLLLRPAINRTYSEANFPGVQYDIVNHGAQYNGIRDEALRREYGLDKPEYWNGPLHKFRADAQGYTETASFGSTYRQLVDPSYVPDWLQARIAAMGQHPGRDLKGLPYEAWESGQPLPYEVVREMRADLAQPSLPPDAERLATGRVKIFPSDEPGNQANLRKQQQAGDILAQAGYHVEHEPRIPGAAKKPDYLIEGKVFDCYAPVTTDPDAIWYTVKQKVSKGQADRIVLTLQGNPSVDLGALKSVFDNYPMLGLKELILITPEGGVAHLWP